MSLSGVLRWLWINSVHPAIQLICVALCLIFSVSIPVASIFAVGYVVDTYGDIWAFLFIPWFLILPILLMPLVFLFNCADGKREG